MRPISSSINVLPEQVADARAELLRGHRRRRGVSPDGARPPRGGQRRCGRHVQVRRCAGAQAGRARIQPVVDDALPKGNALRRANSGRKATRATRRACRSRTASPKTLGVQAGRLADVRHRGHARGGQVTSLRKVDWDSFRVNFFALFPPGPLDATPATYIAAFRAPAASSAWLSSLRAQESEHPGHRHRRDRAPGAGHRRQRVARGRVRVPVHACRWIARAAGGDRGHAGRAQVRRRHPAHARRIAAAIGERANRRVPAVGRAGRIWSRPPAPPPSAGRWPSTCSSFRSSSARSSGFTASSAARSRSRWRVGWGRARR